jgi:hypothetical protein
LNKFAEMEPTNYKLFMSEKTKLKKTNNVRRKETAKKFPVEKPENGEQGSLSDDQLEKSYYYDDAYGYEIYNPEEDDENV